MLYVGLFQFSEINGIASCAFYAAVYAYNTKVFVYHPQ